MKHWAIFVSIMSELLLNFDKGDDAFQNLFSSIRLSSLLLTKLSIYAKVKKRNESNNQSLPSKAILDHFSLKLRPCGQPGPLPIDGGFPSLLIELEAQVL